MLNIRLLTTLALLIAAVVLAACNSDDEAVPTPNVFQPSATVERSKVPDAPPLPIIRLRNEAGLHGGDRGSWCWPQPEGVSLCADTIFLEGPPPPIGVAKGESLTVEIEAHADPEALSASVFEVGTTDVVQSVELETALRSELQLDPEPGVYTVHVNGRWDVGDIFYAFQIEIS